MERPNISVTTLPPRKAARKSPIPKRKSRPIPVSNKVRFCTFPKHLEKWAWASARPRFALTRKSSGEVGQILVESPTWCQVGMFESKIFHKAHLSSRTSHDDLCDKWKSSVAGCFQPGMLDKEETNQVASAPPSSNLASKPTRLLSWVACQGEGQSRLAGFLLVEKHRSKTTTGCLPTHPHPVKVKQLPQKQPQTRICG